MTVGRFMFDPYHKWLGIPPGKRPPTHYQLLGLPQDETDPEVIHAASLNRSAYVRNFQRGAQGDDAARILTELASAELCLLNPSKRAVYDATIEGRPAVSPTHSPAAVPSPAAPQTPAVPPSPANLLTPLPTYSATVPQMSPVPPFAGPSLPDMTPAPLSMAVMPPPVMGYGPAYAYDPRGAPAQFSAGMPGAMPWDVDSQPWHEKIPRWAMALAGVVLAMLPAYLIYRVAFSSPSPSPVPVVVNNPPLNPIPPQAPPDPTPSVPTKPTQVETPPKKEPPKTPLLDDKVFDIPAEPQEPPESATTPDPPPAPPSKTKVDFPPNKPKKIAEDTPLSPWEEEDHEEPPPAFVKLKGEKPDDPPGEVRWVSDLSWGIKSLAFSPNGGLLALGKMDDALLVFDVGQGKRTAAIPKLRGLGSVLACVFTPDGSKLLTAGDSGMIGVWRVKGGQVQALGNFSGHSSSVNCISVSGDSKYVLSGDSSEIIHYWRLDDAELLGSFSGLQSNVKACRISRDRRFGLATDGRAVLSIDLVNREVRSNVEMAGGSLPQGAAFSPDGKYVATADSTVCVWELKTGKRLMAAKASDLQWSVAFMADSTRLITGANGKINVWDAEVGQRAGGVNARDSGYIQALATSPDNIHFASAGGPLGALVQVFRYPPVESQSSDDDEDR